MKYLPNHSQCPSYFILQDIQYFLSPRNKSPNVLKHITKANLDVNLKITEKVHSFLKKKFFSGHRSTEVWRCLLRFFSEPLPLAWRALLSRAGLYGGKQTPFQNTQKQRRENEEFSHSLQMFHYCCC